MLDLVGNPEDRFSHNEAHIEYHHEKNCCSLLHTIKLQFSCLLVCFVVCYRSQNFKTSRQFFFDTPKTGFLVVCLDIAPGEVSNSLKLQQKYADQTPGIMQTLRMRRLIAPLLFAYGRNQIVP